VDLGLSDEQKAVQSAVRDWVAAVVTPNALRNDREERFARPASSA
jgi:Arc/MetJ family transcription regulator